jgi:hypothetical protein
MKILIDPMLAILAKDISVDDKAELLMCILEYPNRDCGLGLWKYVRQQIDADAQKYREKCERMAENAKGRWNLKSYPKSDMKSPVIEEISKANVIKENSNCKESVSSNACAIVENSVNNFVISDRFSFQVIAKQNPKFANYLALYIPAVVERAQKTLIQKRIGQNLSLSQILDWLEQESQFYELNHRGAQ